MFVLGLRCQLCQCFCSLTAKTARLLHQNYCSNTYASCLCWHGRQVLIGTSVCKLRAACTSVQGFREPRCQI